MKNYLIGKEATFELLVRFQLGRFMHLADQIEDEYKDTASFFENTIEKDMEKYQNDLKSEDDEIEFQRHIEHLAGEFQEHSSVYPDLIRKSILISIWSFYEHHLVSFCKINGSTDTYFNRAIEKAHKYINNDLKINFPKDEYWDLLDAVKEIRHAIVHDGSFIEENCCRSKIIKNSKLKHYSITDDYKLIIEEEFIPEFVEILSIKLKQLYV